MRKQIYKTALIIAATLLAISACQNERVSDNPSMRLSFSADSVWFDTVFTGSGSSTQTVMVYNRNKNAVRISDITLKGEWFHINLDGENDKSRLHDMTLNGGDSLFLFVRVHVPEQNENTPVVVTDTIWFFTNGNKQAISLLAYGQDVHVIKTDGRRTETGEMTFDNDKPWLVFDTLICTGRVIMPEGTTLYMHQGASLLLAGGLSARGTREKPVRITGDRLDKLFAHVPYQAASGQWGGLWLIQRKEDTAHKDTLNHTDILSGTTGLYCTSEKETDLPHVVIANSRIHNHAAYGIVLLNTDAEIWNTEVSNCASYCLYLSGGRHVLTHNTIASYFGWPHTNLNIHTTGKEDAAAVYINNLDKESPKTEVVMRNNIVAGARKNNMVLATPLADYYEGEFSGNYLQCDSLLTKDGEQNTYGSTTDTVFVNTWYRYKEYVYYDFRLDSISPARCAGDSSVLKDERFTTDRLGNKRGGRKPDAGCYTD
ncbi:MAG: hypothetical protein II970_03880 [Paludibacteraceae bacterium]|nr:hypothetical protein [Paludibacteraceae bacterium]